MRLLVRDLDLVRATLGDDDRCDGRDEADALDLETDRAKPRTGLDRQDLRSLRRVGLDDRDLAAKRVNVCPDGMDLVGFARELGRQVAHGIGEGVLARGNDPVSAAHLLRGIGPDAARDAVRSIHAARDTPAARTISLCHSDAGDGLAVHDDLDLRHLPGQRRDRVPELFVRNHADDAAELDPAMRVRGPIGCLEAEPERLVRRDRNGVPRRQRDVREALLKRQDPLCSGKLALRKLGSAPLGLQIEIDVAKKLVRRNDLTLFVQRLDLQLLQPEELALARGRLDQAHRCPRRSGTARHRGSTARATVLDERDHALRKAKIVRALKLGDREGRRDPRALHRPISAMKVERPRLDGQVGELSLGERRGGSLRRRDRRRGYGRRGKRRGRFVLRRR